MSLEGIMHDTQGENINILNITQIWTCNPQEYLATRYTDTILS